MRGRRPVPTAIKSAEGNPGKRPLSKADLNSSPGRPTAPSWLDKDARYIFEQVGEELLKHKIIRPIDELALACLADSAANLKVARRRMQKMKADLRKQKKDPDDALLYKTPGGSVIQSPSSES